MLFDVVEEVHGLVETLVSSLPKPVEGEVVGLKLGSKSLSDDANQKLGKLEQKPLDSILDAAGNASTSKQWTGKMTASVVYDSTVDEFTDQCLFNKVKGKPNIMIVATTTDGDVFGGFYSVTVTRQDELLNYSNMFIFSFDSHGRCKTPQRFVVKEKWMGRTRVKFFKNNSEGQFVRVDGGAGWFYLGYEKSNTWCSNLSRGF